jgi:Ca2+-binding RTX toxin-like protein
VRLAETWTTQRTAANEQSVTLSASPSLNILDHTTITSSISNTTALDIDFIEITVDISHTYRGDLVIRLISPSGATSVLMNQAAMLTTSNTWVLDSRDDLRWTFGTTQHWGETGVGSWTLSVSDVETGDTGRLNSWTLRLYGDAPSSDDTYIYTDEFDESFSRDAAHATQRATLNDSDGGIDTINAAALSGAAIIRLDGGASSIDGHALAIVANVIENIFAGDGNDTLAGSSAANSLYGGRGDDTLIADAGDDRLDGGDGVDIVSYAAASGPIAVDLSTGASSGLEAFGNDVLVGIEGIGGGSAGDTLNGDSGANLLVGGPGDDTLRGREGDDTYDVDSALDVILEDEDGGRDLVRSSVAYTLPGSYVEDLALYGAAALLGVGNAADNRLYGSAFANTLRGLAGHDTIYGAAGADSLFGGDGDDVLDGGTGQDYAEGGAGNDTYFVDSALDVVVEAPGGGLDIVFASASYTLAGGVEILRLVGNGLSATGSNDGETIFGDSGANVLAGLGGSDSLFGDSSSDTLFGGEGDDRLYGGSDNDRLEGGDGDDFLDGGSATDALYGGFGADSLAGGDGNDRLDGGDGDDFLDGGADGDTLYGGAGNDSLVGGAGFDRLEGGAGNDRLEGGAATDVLDGGDGDDFVDGGADSDTLYGGAGDDSLVGGAGFDRLEGGAGNDQLEGGAEPDVLDGGDGDDTLQGGASWDMLYGGVGNDRLDGDEDQDRLYGGVGDDRLYGGVEADTLFGGDGDDSLDGGQGDDRLDGGGGNDRYFVDSTGDSVVENANGGNDTVVASLSMVLADHVETLVLIGDAATEGIGNALANTLLGSAAANRLRGGDGNDTLDGAGGADQLFGGAGDDVLLVDGDDTTVSGGAGYDVAILTGANTSNLVSTGIERYELRDGDDVFAPAAIVIPPTAPPTTLSLGELDGISGVRIVGGVAGAHLGWSVAGLGDVNGDGRGDFIVSAPVHTGSSNTSVNGNAYVVFGKAGGWGDTLDVTQLDGQSGFRLTDSRLGQVGYFVDTAGDVNGDGLADILLGSPAANNQAGEAYVVFGKAGGWNATVDIAGLNGTNGFTLAGSAFSQFATSGSSAGDVNGDGFGDLIIGAPRANVSYIVFGHAGAWSPTVAAASLGGTSGVVVVGANGDTGTTVSEAGDVNGDGFGDVLVSTLVNGNVGASHLIYGHGGAWSPISLSQVNGAISTLFMPPEYGLAALGLGPAGDVNGDGFDDFLLSTNAGSTYVVFGRAGGFGATFDLGGLNGGNGAVISGWSWGGSAPLINAAGDLDGDGFSDIIGGDNLGGARIVYGHAGPWLTGISVTQIPSDLTTLLTNAINSSNASVDGIGDINGDGAMDVIVGAHSASQESGAAYVVFGWPTTTVVRPDEAFVVDGGDGNDTIAGRSAADQLIGGAGLDQLSGAAGNDTLYGGDAADTLYGGDGNDTLYGGDGIDRLAGGAGDDFYWLDDADIVDETSAGSGGIDRVDAAYSGHTLAEGVEIGAVKFIGDGVLSGSSGANTLLGGIARDTLSGLGGADTLYGFVGDDLLDGGDGDDRLDGGDGNDRLQGGLGADRLFGGAGDDTYVVDDPNDTVSEKGAPRLYAQNSVTGDIASWDAASTLGAASAMTRPGVGWLWAGRGDFNGDGAADNLFRHVGTGQNLVWYLDGDGAQIGAANLSLSPIDTGWAIAGVADFTGDGKPDILWRHSATGLASLWQMNGVTATATTLLPIQVGVEWQIAGVADFTGDGKADILWRHATAGLTSLWRMNGATPVVFSLLSASAPVGWEVGAVGDVTGDGKADIVWRTGGGATSLWQMDGATRLAVVTPALALPDGNWRSVALQSAGGGGGGHDIVESSTSYALVDDIEDLTLTGLAAINGTGNGLDNVLTGNAAANTLAGAAGRDTLFGGDGSDVLFGGANNDLLYGGDLADTLHGDGGDDVAYGGLGSDILYGGDGNDTLDGGGGGDTLFGGAGGDVYRVDDSGDVVVEAAGTPITTLFGQNRITGDVVSWDVTSGLGAAVAASRPGIGWLWAGRGDFNNDGVTDNLFRHVGTGENRVWYLDAGGAKIGEANLSLSPIDTGWSIAGVGDFTGDGKADILWRHQGAGLASLWRMDGVNAVATTLLPIQVGSEWRIAGAADFTGDGKVDILWRHDAAGLTSLWQMDGANPVAFGLLAASAPVGWDVGAVGDFTGDGKADIAWRTGAGGSQLWEMDGATRVAVTTPASLPDSDWMTIGVERTTIADRDRVESSVSYTLGAGVEDLTLVGNAAIDGTGNAAANTIVGNSGVNTLRGGLGDDVLSGGGGDDIFAYAAGDGDDAITDFAAGDKVALSGVTFANTGVSANIAVLSDGHTITAQAGYIWTASDFI